MTVLKTVVYSKISRVISVPKAVKMVEDETTFAVLFGLTGFL